MVVGPSTTSPRSPHSSVRSRASRPTIGSTGRLVMVLRCRRGDRRKLGMRHLPSSYDPDVEMALYAMPTLYTEEGADYFDLGVDNIAIGKPRDARGAGRLLERDRRTTSLRSTGFTRPSSPCRSPSPSPSSSEHLVGSAVTRAPARPGRPTAIRPGRSSCFRGQDPDSRPRPAPRSDRSGGRGSSGANSGAHRQEARAAGNLPVGSPARHRARRGGARGRTTG